MVSSSGKVEVNWPSILGGHWYVIVNELEMMKGIRWPGKRRARSLLGGLDAAADVLAVASKFPEAEEVEQLSQEIGKPKTESNLLGLGRMTALGWSERPSWTGDSGGRDE